MRTITSNYGTQIYYTDRNTASVVTFPHGWPPNADAWDGQIALRQCRLTNAYDSIKAFSETDFTTQGLKDIDGLCQRSASRGRSDRAVKEIHYPSAPHDLTVTHQAQINADLLAPLRRRTASVADLYPY